jgi:hypothetical protein
VVLDRVADVVIDEVRVERVPGCINLHAALLNPGPPNTTSTGAAGNPLAWIHRRTSTLRGAVDMRLPSDLEEWELSRLPYPWSRGHLVGAIVACRPRGERGV